MRIPHAFDAHASDIACSTHIQALAWQMLSCPLQDAVHAMLCTQLSHPPTLHACAAMADMNVNKLKSGFRQMFSTSVYAFSKNQRLEQARLLLESGALPVKAVAHQFGYSAAGFSTVFRQRFGVNPSALALGRA